MEATVTVQTLVTLHHTKLHHVSNYSLGIDRRENLKKIFPIPNINNNNNNNNNS